MKNINCNNSEIKKTYQLRKMQANCLVFPSPQRFNIEPILYKIVLIPQDNEENQHIAYHHYLNLCAFNDDDQFEKTIKHLNNQHMLKTRDQSKYDGSNSFGVDQSFKKQQKSKKNYTSTTKQSQRQNRKVEHDSNSRSSGLQGNKSDNRVSCEDFITCLFVPGKKDKIVVFFHANAEDISSSFQFLKMVTLQSQYSILAMQYRGYSISKGETNPQLIAKDANRVIQYLQHRNISHDQIIVCGRSIGCAIALGVVAEQFRAFAIVLLSPFLSLKKIAQQLYGNCAGWALKQGFDNQKNSMNINSPLLLIHGIKDTLVPYQHSLALFSQCKSYCQLKLVENMTHSKFNFRLDFIRHFQTFINDLQQKQNY